jgi:hypothetical protein
MNNLKRYYEFGDNESDVKLKLKKLDKDIYSKISLHIKTKSVCCNNLTKYIISSFVSGLSIYALFTIYKVNLI